jgi:protein-L-isoaspartate(D-aspartate) O-methyltransferase
MQPKIKILTFLCFIAFISCAADKEPDNQTWWHSKAEKMVEEQLRGRDITDKKVLEVMEQTPRHMFMPVYLKHLAYEDHPFPIGHGQTISQPYIVALMTELLELNGSEKVLEIGTGSGYQAAILSKLAAQVYTIEIIPDLAEEARVRLAQMGYTNVHVITGDGYKGLPQFAPFDSIIVTAAPKEIPQALAEQLKPGGKMVIPVGEFSQQLMLITKTRSGIKKENVIPVRFVPMVSE